MKRWSGLFCGSWLVTILGLAKGAAKVEGMNDAIFFGTTAFMAALLATAVWALLD